MYQFSLKGELIKTWNSINDIIEYYSCNPSRFHMAAINKYSAYFRINNKLFIRFKKSKSTYSIFFRQNFYILLFVDLKLS